MADEWRESTWGEEISLEYGKRLQGYAEGTGSIRVFGTNGPVGWTDEPLAPGPGIIVGRKGAYRGVHYSRNPFFVIDTAYYVAPKTDLHMRWLYYAIIHHKLGELNDGSPIPSTTRSAVYVRELRIPPKGTQEAISAILGRLDDKIQLNRRMNRLLEGMARAIFKAWFIDFEPVKAKAAGAASFPGMPQHVFDQLPDSFVNSELGEIPEGWEVARVRSLCKRVENGGTPKRKVSEFWTPEEVPWLTSGEVRQPFIVATENHISQRGFENSSTKMWPAYTTVIALYGATAGIATMLGMELCANQACCGLVPKPRTAFFVHQSMSFRLAALQQQARGSAQQNLSPSIVADDELVVPSQDCIDAYEMVAEPLYRSGMLNLRESGTLSAIRDILLPQTNLRRNIRSFNEWRQRWRMIETERACCCLPVVNCSIRIRDRCGFADVFQSRRDGS